MLQNYPLLVSMSIGNLPIFWSNYFKANDFLINAI